MPKRGQVSAFIIAGILILVVVGLFSISRTELSKIPSQPGQIQTPQIQLEQEALSLQAYLDSCLKESLLKAQDAGTQPRDIAAQEAAIAQGLESCSDFSSQQARGISIDKGKPTVKLSETPDVIAANVNYPLTIHAGLSEISFSTFNSYIKRKDAINLNPGTYSLNDGKAELTVQDSTKATDQNGNPVTQLSLQIIDADLAKVENYILLTSTVYDLGPDGTNFNPPLLLSIAVPGQYSPDQAKDFKIGYFDKKLGAWVAWETRYDDARHMLIAEVGHLTEMSTMSKEAKLGKYSECSKNQDSAYLMCSSDKTQIIMCQKDLSKDINGAALSCSGECEEINGQPLCKAKPVPEECAKSHERKGLIGPFGKAYAGQEKTKDSAGNDVSNDQQVAACCPIDKCYEIRDYRWPRRVYPDVVKQDGALCETISCVNNYNYIGVYTGREKKGNDFIAADNPDSKCKALQGKAVNPEGKAALLAGCGVEPATPAQPGQPTPPGTQPPAAPPGTVKGYKAAEELTECAPHEKATSTVQICGQNQNAGYVIRCLGNGKQGMVSQRKCSVACKDDVNDLLVNVKLLGRCIGVPGSRNVHGINECNSAEPGLMVCVDEIKQDKKTWTFECTGDGNEGYFTEHCPGSCKDGKCINRCEGKNDGLYCDSIGQTQAYYRCQGAKETAKGACNENEACVARTDNKGVITLCEALCPSSWKFTGTYESDQLKWSEETDPFSKGCATQKDNAGNTIIKRHFFNALAKGARCEKPVNDCKASGPLIGYDKQCSNKKKSDKACSGNFESIITCSGAGDLGVAEKCPPDSICNNGKCDSAVCPSPPSGEKDFNECKDNYRNSGLIENYCGSGCNHDFIIECGPPCSDPKRIPCLQNPGIRQKKPCEHGCVMVKPTQGAENAQCAASPSQPTLPGPGAAPPGTQPPGAVPPPAALTECNGKSANDKVCGQGNNNGYVIHCTGQAAGTRDASPCPNGCDNGQCKADPVKPPKLAGIPYGYVEIADAAKIPCPLSTLYVCGGSKDNIPGTNTPATDIPMVKRNDLQGMSLLCKTTQKGYNWYKKDCSKLGLCNKFGVCEEPVPKCPQTPKVMYEPDPAKDSLCKKDPVTGNWIKGYVSCEPAGEAGTSVYCDQYGNACVSTKAGVQQCLCPDKAATNKECTNNAVRQCFLIGEPCTLGQGVRCCSLSADPDNPGTSCHVDLDRSNTGTCAPDGEEYKQKMRSREGKKCGYTLPDCSDPELFECVQDAIAGRYGTCQKRPGLNEPCKFFLGVNMPKCLDGLACDGWGGVANGKCIAR